MDKNTFRDNYQKLKSMRFSGMAEELKNQYEDPNITLLSADERICRLIEAENGMRRSKKLNRLISAAGLKYPSAVLDIKTAVKQGADASVIEKLADCDWIESRKNLVITGPTGAGKSYIACGLTLAAIHNFKTAKYIKASALLRELFRADERQELTETLNRYFRYDVLIIDDFGLMNLDPKMCHYLFELIDTRDERKSTIAVSQLPVSEWYDLFSDNTYADATLDRLIRRAHRITLNGKSLRQMAD